MDKQAFAKLLVAATALLLSACSVPDWIVDNGENSSSPSTEAYPESATVEATGTPIDALALASPAATWNSETPESVVPYPDVATPTAAIQEPRVELCKDANSGNSLNYEQALAIAAESECTRAGNLLPAHFCSQNSGVWWIGLQAQKEGCNPACVVDVNSRSAGVNWRCTGAVVPAEDAVQTGQQANENNSSSDDSGRFSDQQGVIYRQPHGSLVEYRFLGDDGQWFDIGTTSNEVRQQFAGAAWAGSKVVLSAEETAVPDTLSVEGLRGLGTRSSEARDLTTFAMASSSSQLAADEGGPYYAWSAVDGILANPWCEGVEGPGHGEWIQLDFTAPLEISAIELVNGYAGEGNLHLINNRVQNISVYFDGNLAHNWFLFDTRDRQSFSLSDEGAPGVVANSVKLVIGETIPGLEFDDTCIAEVSVWGKPLE